MWTHTKWWCNVWRESSMLWCGPTQNAWGCASQCTAGSNTIKMSYGSVPAEVVRFLITHQWLTAQTACSLLCLKQHSQVRPHQPTWYSQPNIRNTGENIPCLSSKFLSIISWIMPRPSYSHLFAKNWWSPDSYEQVFIQHKFVKHVFFHVIHP